MACGAEQPDDPADRWLSVMEATDGLHVDDFSSNVHAVGGTFFNTGFDGNKVTLAFSVVGIDDHAATFEHVFDGAGGFFGIVSDAGIASRGWQQLLGCRRLDLPDHERSGRRRSCGAVPELAGGPGSGRSGVGQAWHAPVARRRRRIPADLGCRWLQADPRRPAFPQARRHRHESGRSPRHTSAPPRMRRAAHRLVRIAAHIQASASQLRPP